MNKFMLLGIVAFITIFLAGCDSNKNFMDVDNPNAKEDLMSLIGSGNIPNIDVDELIPDNLSGTRKNAKGQAQDYYKNTLEKYVDTAKEGLSGTTQSLKGYYNSGVEELNRMVNDKVRGTISGELNKFKLK